VKKIAVIFASVFALVGGSLAFSAPTLAQDDCGVVISGGSVANSTTLDLNADGGTAIGDASGGDENVAFDFDGDGDIDGDDIAAAGNGGTADSSANGGAIAVGNVNSGGNSGNTIEVGNTTCAPPPPPKPVYEDKKPVYEDKKPVAPVKPVAPAAKKAAAPVAALPNTGTGVAGDVNFGFIALALVGAVAAAGYSVRARFN
jgi:hypothetical protein